MQKSKIDLTQFDAWLMAFRLPTLLIPTIQIFTGSAIAFATTNQFSWLIAFLAWIVAVAITIGTNLINDAVDYERGGDPVNKFGKIKVIPAGLLSKSQVYYGGILAFSFACLIPLLLEQDILICFGIVLLCCIAGYCYTGGPYPISYLGLSEIFIFIFYGGVCVIVPYYAQTYAMTPGIVLASAQMGMLAILPNALNNFRDIKEDAAVNKCTLAVRFGKLFARNEIVVLTFLPFLLNITWLYLGYKGAALMPFFILPLAYTFVKGVLRHEPSQSLNLYFGYSILTHFFFGVMLIIGLLLG